MLSRWLARRTVGRTAIVGLALGLITLATLTTWGIATTRQATAQVRQFDAIGDAWRRAFVHLSAEDSALREYLATGGGDYRRKPLIDARGSVEPDLTWLERHGGAAEATHVRFLRAGYAEYTRTLNSVLAASAQKEDISAYGDTATLSFVPLRDEIVGNIDRNQQDATAFLAEVDHTNITLRWIAAGVVATDLVLFLVCTVVLVGYQRRAERSATINRHQALHDALTGLGNRKLLAERMDQSVEAARRDGGSIGLLLIDLDGFKEINDTLGHHNGDLLLQQVAGRLSSIQRRTDLVVRLGGDEFAILLPDLESPHEATLVADRVQQEIRRPVELGGIKIALGASVGVAIFPADCETVEGLLIHADVAMYVAKRGQLGVSVYEADNDEHNPHRLSLLGELRAGIAAGELVLHYQPKVDANTRRPCGVEALVRWQHPRLGLVYPDRFIPLIEHSELMEDLTDEVLRLAALRVSAWRAAGEYMPIAVNIGARTLLNPQFAARVVAVVDQYAIPPSQLTLELTEGALISDAKRAGEVLDQLRAHGFRLSIDDFGTGYSSMANLRDLPVHELKIDRTFVATMHSDYRNRAIVQAVIDLARNLELQTVAEGVEDEETFTLLRDLGCRSIQGYYVAKPMDAANLDAWLRQRRSVPVPA